MSARAAMVIQGELLGMEEAQQRLERTGQEIRIRLQLALEEGGSLVEEAARGFAPERSGKLRRGIKARFSASAKALVERIKPRGVPYSTFVEKGVVNHPGGKALGTKKEKAQLRRRLALASEWRVRPHPYMLPAEIELRDRVQALIVDAVHDGVRLASEAR